MFKGIGLVLFAFLSCTVQAETQPSLVRTNLYGDIIENSELSFESLVREIQTNQLQSIEATLAHLKARFPEFFYNYVLMYHSRSLQGSSSENPRAILFDGSGEFVFSFNGEEEQRGYDRLEIMQFRDEGYKFEFREIAFRDGKVEVSEANPQKCMACHQSTDRVANDPRPNWEPYSFWPGAYASNAGFFHEVQGGKTNIFGPEDSLIKVQQAREEKMLASFLDNKKSGHARYKHLEEFEPHSSVTLTLLLARLNFRRLVRIWTTDYKRELEVIKYPLLGALRCGKLFLDEDFRKWIRQMEPEPEIAPLSSERMTGPQSREEIKDQLLSILRGEGIRYSFEEITEMVDEIVERNKLRKFEFPSITASEAIHDLFEPFGISTSDWSMDFKTGGRFAFRERFGTPTNTADELEDAFKRVAPDMYNEVDCKESQEWSTIKLRHFMDTDHFAELMHRKAVQERGSEAKPLINRCINCHNSGDPAIPLIPFDDELRLKAALSQPTELGASSLYQEIMYRVGDYAKEEERMPLGPRPSERQRLDLIAYIKDLYQR